MFTSYMPGVASAALVVVLAQAMASLTWDMMPEKPYVAPPEISENHLSRSNPQNVSSSASTYNKIISFHLFGMARNEAAQPVVAPVSVAQEAPDTQLTLTLKGVVASADMIDAWAIVADRTGNEDSYGIDAPLPGGAILKEIYSDRIILLHNGRLETLRLPTSDLGASNNARSTNSRRSSSRNNRRQQSSRSTSNVNRLSSQATQSLRGYKDKLLNDPQSVMNSVRAEPYRQSGRLKGYRIFPGKDKELFGQIGLEPGDIVTSVNGIELDSPLKGLEIMQQLSGTSNVSVNVLRNGVSQTFETSLN
ncbi:MAG: type II secretion system protein GspC [Gammaproteobacteria bacterium]|nr:type II secretion system protein GspC [Gammaproteobacteria bacterium]